MTVFAHAPLSRRRFAVSALASALALSVAGCSSLTQDSPAPISAPTQQDIAEALTAQGYTVDKKQIEMEEHIKKLGMFTIAVRIHPKVEGKVRLLVEQL